MRKPLKAYESEVVYPACPLRLIEANTTTPILLQNALSFPTYLCFPLQELLLNMTTRPSHKAPSSLLSATKASTARTRSSSCLAHARHASTAAASDDLSGDPKGANNLDTSALVFVGVGHDAAPLDSDADPKIKATGSKPNATSKGDDVAATNTTKLGYPGIDIAAKIGNDNHTADGNNALETTSKAASGAYSATSSGASSETVAMATSSTPTGVVTGSNNKGIGNKTGPSVASGKVAPTFTTPTTVADGPTMIVEPTIATAKANGFPLSPAAMTEDAALATTTPAAVEDVALAVEEGASTSAPNFASVGGADANPIHTPPSKCSPSGYYYSHYQYGSVLKL